VENLIIVLKRP